MTIGELHYTYNDKYIYIEIPNLQLIVHFRGIIPAYSIKEYGEFDRLDSIGALFQIDRGETWCHLATLLHLSHVSDPDRTTPRVMGKDAET